MRWLMLFLLFLHSEPYKAPLKKTQTVLQPDNNWLTEPSCSIVAVLRKKTYIDNTDQDLALKKYHHIIHMLW